MTAPVDPLPALRAAIDQLSATCRELLKGVALPIYDATVEQSDDEELARELAIEAYRAVLTFIEVAPRVTGN